MSGAPSPDDFFPALRWVDRLCGVDVVMAHLQSHLCDRWRICDIGDSRDVEKKKD
jgi:hypothetical protein